MVSPFSCDGSSTTNTSRFGNNKRRRRCCFVSLQPAAPVALSVDELESDFAPLASSSRSPIRATAGRSSSAFVPPATPQVAAAVAAAAEAAARTAAPPIVFPRSVEDEPLPNPSSRRLRRRTGTGNGGPSASASAGAGARGVLSRVTKTAAVAAAAASAVGVLATAPAGVGALMTEAQCESATLRGTEAELMESPRSDNSTEAAAAGVDQTIVATQTTFDRMVTDQLAIARTDGRDIAFRNLWSDHVWLGTAEVTFAEAEALALFLEGSLPEFNCMNEHYGLSFVKGDAGETHAEGTLTADKVLNWSLLGPDYVALDGVYSFTPTDVTSVPSTTYLVAAAQTEEDGVFDVPVFHYFLAESVDDVDPPDCPEPCTGEVVSYYMSFDLTGDVFLLGVSSADADDPRPCWLNLFDAVKDGPPAGGVDASLWEELELCTAELIQENFVDGDGTSDASDASSSSSGGTSAGGYAVAAAVLIPAILAIFVIAAFGLCRHQRHRRAKKMKTTDEAWGVGLDGNGGERGKKSGSGTPPSRPRPPAGRFKLAPLVTQASKAVTDSDAGGVGDGNVLGVASLTSFSPPPPPPRVLTDVSIDEQDDGAGVDAAAAGDAGPGRQQQRRRQQAGVAVLADEEGVEDSVYP